MLITTILQYRKKDTALKMKPNPRQKVIDGTRLTGIYKIPEHEKPIVSGFVKPLPVLEQSCVITQKFFCKTEDFSIWLKCIKTKYPHYEYIQRTKRKGCKWQYWFSDTSRNIKVILTQDNINDVLKQAKTKIYFRSVFEFKKSENRELSYNL
jgi:hypothetical protein